MTHVLATTEATTATGYRSKRQSRDRAAFIGGYNLHLHATYGVEGTLPKLLDDSQGEGGGAVALDSRPIRMK